AAVVRKPPLRLCWSFGGQATPNSQYQSLTTMKHAPHLPILKDLGLSAAEALIYEVLLEEGPSPGAKIAQLSGIGRGNAYNSLASLKDKGLVEEEPGKKTVFRVTDPERLRGLAKARREAAEALWNQLDSVLPGLKESYRIFTKQPTVRVFGGIEGLKDVYRETLREKQPIYALVSPDEPAPEIFRWLTTNYVRERVKLGIEVKAVVNGESKTAEYIAKGKAELREARFVSSAKYPFRGEIDAFGDKTAFIAYKKEELIGVIIESPSIAETLRSAVKLLLDLLPPPKPLEEA
ncbi:MAG: helix-turn-helix domain-containing protein, partial [Acidobacteriota bacterium]